MTLFLLCLASRDFVRENVKIVVSFALCFIALVRKIWLTLVDSGFPIEHMNVHETELFYDYTVLRISQLCASIWINYLI